MQLSTLSRRWGRPGTGRHSSLADIFCSNAPLPGNVDHDQKSQLRTFIENLKGSPLLNRSEVPTTDKLTRNYCHIPSVCLALKLSPPPNNINIDRCIRHSLKALRENQLT